MSGSNPVSSGIRLPADFQINAIKSLPLDRLHLALDAPPPLGVLGQFTGTFSGRGFNLIFRPQSTLTPTPLPVPAHGPNDNILELNLTTETLAFSPSLGSVPNRGMVQGDIFLNGVPYLQTISDGTKVGSANPTVKPVGIHFEPGIWLAVPSTTQPPEPATFVRMASIPHGTTINLQGTASQATPGGPTIPPIDPTPFLIGTRQPIRFPSQTANDPATFRLPQDLSPHIADGTITQAILDDPNTVLRNAIAGQRIVETVTLTVASAPEQPPGPLAIPKEGGGTDNIAFLQGSSAPNALVPTQQAGPGGRTLAGVKSTFWIETVEHVIHLPPFQLGQPVLTIPADPHPLLGTAGPKFHIRPPFPILTPTTLTVHSTQIQYSQVVLLSFNGLIWPHISVATLTPAEAITPPASLWHALRPPP